MRLLSSAGCRHGRGPSPSAPGTQLRACHLDRLGIGAHETAGPADGPPVASTWPVALGLCRVDRQGALAAAGAARPEARGSRAALHRGEVVVPYPNRPQGGSSRPSTSRQPGGDSARHRGTLQPSSPHQPPPTSLPTKVPHRNGPKISATSVSRGCLAGHFSAPRSAVSH